jgi:hypothetical protein
LGGFVDAFHKLQHIMGEAVYYGYTDIVIVFVLRDSIDEKVNENRRGTHTEYEFSLISDEPVAKMFGE